MKIAIEGYAAVGSFGFGQKALQRALHSPPAPDTGGSFPVLPKADVSVISSFMQTRALRQIDHFTRMALIAAFAALADADLAPEDARDAGLVLASGYGPAQTTFAFLDSIEEHGANLASPLAFSFSVHNIPAANVALKLGMRGPCTTVCQFESSVVSALLTAASWLAEGRVSRVLFGAVDETTPILADISARMAAEKGRCEKHGRRSLPLGEGAAFFCLSKATGGAKALIEDVWLGTVADRSAVTGGKEAGDTYYSGSLRGLPDAAGRESLRRAAAYGNLPVAMAFDMVAALGALERGESSRIFCVSSSPAGVTGSAALSLPEPQEGCKAELIFETSGSTGVPKTYAYPPAVLREEAEALRPYFQSRKRVVSVMPVRHIFGYVMGRVLPEFLGIPALVFPPLPVAELFEALRPGDLLVAFPVFWQAVFERFAAKGGAVRDLMGATASAPCPPELIEKLTSPSRPGEVPYCVKMVEIYGSTETSAIGIRVSPREPYALLPLWERVNLPGGSVGIARIREEGRREPPLQLPDEVAWQGERLLVPVKRKDNAVQVGGVNVYPHQVETIIRAHPAVKECAVRLMNPDEGVRLKAFIVPVEPAASMGKGVFGAEFRAWLRERLMPAAVPKSITLGDALPVSPTGKSRDWNIRN